jgi:hypothetical protein
MATLILLDLFPQGEFGMVHRSLLADRERELQVAVKLLSSPDPEDRIRLLQEAMLMANLDHPNVLRLLGSCSCARLLRFVYRTDGTMLIELGYFFCSRCDHQI